MKAIPYLTMLRVLKKHYEIQEFVNKAKGSERMLARRTKSGSWDQYPAKYRTLKTMVKVGSLYAILRHFDIDPKDFESKMRKKKRSK